MSEVTSDAPPVLVAGDLAVTTLDDVLIMVAASRQGLLLVLTEGDREVGRLRLKAGMLLAAQAADASTGPAAVVSIRHAQPTSFALHVVSVDADTAVLGPLDEAWDWAETQPPPQARTGPISLFRGNLAEVPLTDLLAVLSVSRQTLGILFWRDGVPVGSWVAKAGQILAADLLSEPELDDREAFARIMADPGDRYSVVEMPARGDETPVGSFFELSQPRARRELIRIGPTSSVSFGELLGELSGHDAPTGLVLRHKGVLVGETVVHAAHVRWARVTPRDGPAIEGRAAIAELASAFRRPDSTFEIYRGDVVGDETLGAVVDLLAELRGQRRSGGGSAPRRLFGGSFERMPLADLLAVLSVSRRRLGVVLRRGRTPIGGWVVKAGQVLDAVVLGKTLPAAQAIGALRADPGTHFMVVEYDRPLSSERLVGGFEELWTGAMPAPAESTDEVLVVGDLGDTPLFVILMSLGLSRQHTVIELLVGEVCVGSIEVRSGQLLSATHSSGFQGTDAVFRLLISPVARRFRLLRRVGASLEGAEPIGSLDQVMSELRDALIRVGPRLVVPGESELSAWLDEPRRSSAPIPAAPRDVEELGRRVSTLQMLVLLQAAMMVMLLAVLVLVLVLASR
ncbi:MAG: DUF4388 domain-containing protein [Myxococcales bacterium]|nr:DUF4388 domain-containing protein [Myxococcales bacterium]